MAKAKNSHYVDNEKFYSAMVEYKKKVREAEANGTEKPRVPEYVGDCIIKIATHRSFSYNFSSYPFREEMISDAIENCLQYIDNFDEQKYTNPFAYFSRIVWFAFLRRIAKEKKHLYTKHVLTELASLNGEMSENGDSDDNHQIKYPQSDFSHEKMLEFMDAFEDNKRKKRKKSVDNKKSKAVS